ncbi:MAG TPA: branched-chain amino acid ABC transporter permease [Xanthobacteraceae bacterium]|nr:branched-chain amino acid ABC transporter permease [Xanthobacteraceae bacterium]
MDALGPFLEILIGGLLSGVLYSLVALGFVLIFKASGVFNFAQGAMVLLAGLALVRSLDFMTAHAFPFWIAAALALLFAGAVMALTAYFAERFVLGPLVNQNDLTLFMATIGLAFILQGAGQIVFGSDVYPLNLYPTDAWILLESLFTGGILINKLDVWGGVIAGLLVVGLALFFQRTKTGRALRAVADDHSAAQSVGISIDWIWFVVWLASGLVALAAATVWGTKLGVQFSIVFLALKAFPVLIIGGFTSVPGAIIGGLLIGAGEKLAEAYLGPFIGGGIEYWFAYVVALLVLLVRPQGLFGERIIERI